ncbi:MAG: hypothetical protein ACREOK_13895 [Gemmatimonadaceae bacterium]
MKARCIFGAHFIVCSLSAALVPALGAQDTARVAAPAPARDLRVFLDCSRDCDDDYLQTETPWVAFVRDRTDADVHLLITTLDTGAGGEEYTINFVGLGAFGGRNDTLRFVSHSSNTFDEQRRGLTRTIQLGLGPFVARTPVGTRLRMTLDASDGTTPRITPANDPWRAWVFELDGFGSMSKEQRQSSMEWGGSFEARRITSAWKFGAFTDAFFDESRFVVEEDDGTSRTIKTLRENYSAGGVLVKSLGGHWGAGVQLRVGASTFENTKFAIRAAPAIEYSFFPYDQFTRRQLTLQYSAGVSSFRYRELTIFGRMDETRPTHALLLGYDVNQPWGDAELTVETSRYMDNSSQWRLHADGEMEVRIVRGLSFEIGGGASLIRDQLAIPARGATPEEILLELRALQTDYRYDARVGLSYSFGSIFSSVVNPRFGTGPGEILR